MVKLLPRTTLRACGRTGNPRVPSPCLLAPGRYCSSPSFCPSLEVKVFSLVSSRERRSLYRMLESSANGAVCSCAQLLHGEKTHGTAATRRPHPLLPVLRLPAAQHWWTLLSCLYGNPSPPQRASRLCLLFSRNGGKGERPKMAAATRPIFLTEKSGWPRPFPTRGSACWTIDTGVTNDMKNVFGHLNCDFRPHGLQ